jgi:hypothetical protein
LRRARDILGIVAALMLLLSSAAHSLLGWRAMHGELPAAQVPGDLMAGLKIGWQFGGVAMLTLGVILLTLFAQRLRAGTASLVPARIVSLDYLAFGAWALVASRGEPFFFVLIVPGLWLAIAPPSPSAKQLKELAER